MPTLLETDNPPAIFPEHALIPEIHGEWYLACVVPKSDKRFAWSLFEREIPYFLPMCAQPSRAAGRAVIVQRLLFPGYVFFCGDESAVSIAHGTGKIIGDNGYGVLKDGNQKRLRNELRELQQAIDSGVALSRFEGPVSGEQFEVNELHPIRALWGLQVVEISHDGMKKFIVKVSWLGGVEMEIEPRYLTRRSY